MRIHSNEMTPSEAADYLDLPESFVRQLIENQSLTSRVAGEDVVVFREDVLSYQNEWRKQRLAALNELTQLSQEMGMGY